MKELLVICWCKLKCRFGHHQWCTWMWSSVHIHYRKKNRHLCHMVQRRCNHCDADDKPMKLSKFKLWQKDNPPHSCMK